MRARFDRWNLWCLWLVAAAPGLRGHLEPAAVPGGLPGSFPADVTVAVSGVIGAQREFPLLGPDSAQTTVAQILERRMDSSRAWHNAWRIVRVAKRLGLERYAGVVARQILVESAGNPRAVSSVGAQGLLQIRPELWVGVFAECQANLFDEATNIRCGMRILRHYLDRCGGHLARALNLYSGYGTYGMAQSPYTRAIQAI